MTAPARAPLAPPGAAELRRGSAAVRVAIAPGAPIVSFFADDTEWCAAGPWFDYAPTLNACALPSFVGGVPRAPFEDGGVLRAIEPDVSVRADGAAGVISAQWPAAPYPVAWRRDVSLDAEGALVATYTVTSVHRARLPFVWGTQVALPWRSNVQIDVPRGTRSRVARSTGEGLAKAGSEFAWPALRDGGKLADLSRPATLEPRRSVQCYTELPRGRLTLRLGDVSLEIAGDAPHVTHAHAVVDHDADRPGDAPRRWWRPRAARRVILAGVAAGAPGDLAEAVGAWRTARWIEPGETLHWSVRYRSVRATP
ncbi:MAG TPA: hypothetical protein VE967_02365 [Gemmatimonadaceae bacterium]|nr:hypothetical protein [Gemmatimonadaceae bacterium]